MQRLIPDGLVSAAELMPLCEALLLRAAQADQRTPVIRTGDRDPINPTLRALVYRRDRWRCIWCGNSPFAADKDRRASMLHLDHLVPWSAGGADRSDNLRTLCDSCNGYRSNFRVDMDSYQAVPIVGICAPCLCRVPPGFEVPARAFSVYCASRHHASWAIPGWRIL